MPALSKITDCLKNPSENKEIDAFNLIWYVPAVEEIRKLPATGCFSDINAGFMRSKWADKEAAFVGFKGR